MDAQFGTYRRWCEVPVRPKAGCLPLKAFSSLDPRLGGQASPKVYRLDDVEKVGWTCGEYTDAWLTLIRKGEGWQFSLYAPEEDTLSTAHLAVRAEWRYAKSVWDTVPTA